jgi:hypothetical protein
MLSSTPQKPTRTSRRSPSFRPALDALEDRCVLTALLAIDAASPQHLLGFDSASPGTFTSQVPISGLVSGETLTAISFRPSTDRLYALGVGNYFSSGGQYLVTAHLYTLDPGTGAATLVSPAAGFTLPQSGGDSMSFDPVRDQVRVINTAGANLRLNPATGTVVAQDHSLANQPYAIQGIVYDRAVPGATATTLYGIGSVSVVDPHKTLTTITADVGVVDPVAPVGISMDLGYLFPGLSGTNNVNLNGFSIVPSSTAGGEAYVVYRDFFVAIASPSREASLTQLFTVNLSTGAATLLGNVGNVQPTVNGPPAITLNGIAVVPPPLPPGGGTGGGGGSLPANLTGNPRFVSEVFLALLGRNPDANSLSLFATLLEQGYSRMQFVLDVEHSPEYYYHTVDGLYRDILGRAADATGLQGGALFLAAGGSQDELKALLYGSPEYYQRCGGTDAGFLALCFGGITGQSLDVNSQDVLTGLLSAGVSRTSLALVLLRTPVSGLEQARRFFAEFLGRLPGPLEAGLHGGVVLGSGPEIDLAIILASDEFFNGP